MDKFKQIQSRINAISTQQPAEGPNKLKMKQIQVMIGRLSASLEEDDITRQYKLNEMLQKVKKIESNVKQVEQESAIKCTFLQQSNIEAALQSAISRIQKSMLKKLQKLSKSKKQADKQFQSQLNNYLIQLSGFKTKMTNACLGSISLLKQKELEIQEIHKSHQENIQITREVLKKIYHQYTGQIEQLTILVNEEEQQRLREEAILMERLQRMYQKLTRELKEIRKERQRSESEMILLLQKVVDRVRCEVAKM